MKKETEQANEFPLERIAAHRHRTAAGGIVDGRSSPRHVAAMSCRRVLTLLLLLCGLSTTPFFSLEQSPDDGLTASSVPQSGSRLTGKASELAGPVGAAPDLDGFDGAEAQHPDPDDPAPGHILGAGSTAPIQHPRSGAERLTYHANAPPIPSDARF